MHKNKIIFFSILILALTVAASPSYALLDKFFKKKAEPVVVQKYDIHDEATFKEKTAPYHVIPFNDPKLEFEIHLPKDWTMQRLTLDQAPDLQKKIIGHIARFDSGMIGTAQAHVTVQAVMLDREINARNWLKNFIFTQGFTPDGTVTEKSERKASASYIFVNETISTYTRITAEINGNIVTVAKFEVPLRLKDYLNFLMVASIDSFKMLYTKDSTIEQFKVFTLVDSVKFTYPESWEVNAADFKDANKLSVQLFTKSPSGSVEGFIRVVAVRRSIHTALHHELKSLKKYFDETLHLEFVRMISSEKPQQISDRFIFSQFEVYDVKPKTSDGLQELRLLALGDKEWYVFVFLLTQKEENNLLTWARNIRSLELISKSLK